MGELTYKRNPKFGPGIGAVTFVLVGAVLLGLSAYYGVRIFTDVKRMSVGAPASVEERILSDAMAAAKQNPQSPEAQWRLSLALSTIGDFSAATESAEKAIKLDPKLTEPYYALGIAYKGTGDLARAEKALTKASETPGSHNEVYREVFFDLGLVRTELGDHKGAVKALEAALANGPEATYVVIALAGAYEDAGNTQRAIEEYLAVLGYDPTNQESEEALKRLGVSDKKIEAAKNPIAHQAPTDEQPQQ